MSGGVRSSRVDFVLVEEGVAAVRSHVPGWPQFRGRAAKQGYRTVAEAEARRVEVLTVIAERQLARPDLRVYRRTTEMVRSTERREHFEVRRQLVPVAASELEGEGTGAVAVEQASEEARTREVVRGRR